jgi:hypothetical protein
VSSSSLDNSLGGRDDGGCDESSADMLSSVLGGIDRRCRFFLVQTNGQRPTDQMSNISRSRSKITGCVTILSRAFIDGSRKTEKRLCQSTIDGLKHF